MKSFFTYSITILFAWTIVMYNSCASRKSEPVTRKLFQPSNAHVRHGEIVYMQHCEKCHPGGEAGLGPALNSNPAPQVVKRFQMRHGLGVMPSFTREEISPDDLRDISRYLTALKSQ